MSTLILEPESHDAFETESLDEDNVEDNTEGEILSDDQFVEEYDYVSSDAFEENEEIVQKQKESDNMKKLIISLNDFHVKLKGLTKTTFPIIRNEYIIFCENNLNKKMEDTGQILINVPIIAISIKEIDELIASTEDKFEQMVQEERHKQYIEEMVKREGSQDIQFYQNYPLQKNEAQEIEEIERLKRREKLNTWYPSRNDRKEHRNVPRTPSYADKQCIPQSEINKFLGYSQKKLTSFVGHSRDRKFDDDKYHLWNEKSDNTPKEQKLDVPKEKPVFSLEVERQRIFNEMLNKESPDSFPKYCKVVEEYNDLTGDNKKAMFADHIENLKNPYRNIPTKVLNNYEVFSESDE